jgi:hypothetical protein
MAYQKLNLTPLFHQISSSPTLFATDASAKVLGPTLTWQHLDVMEPLKYSLAYSKKKKKGLSPNAEHLMNKYPSHVKIKEPKPTKLI